MINTLRNIRRGPEQPERVLVLLPGYGDRPEPFLERAAMFDPAEQWLVIVVEPHLHSDQGPYWYNVDENGPDPLALTEAVLSLDALCFAVLSETGLTEDSLAVAGFSQGGALAIAHLLDPTTRVHPMAVATLSGYLPTRESHLIDLTRAENTPVLFAHGIDDELVEPLRGRSAAKAVHRAGGIASWKEVSGGHRFDTPLTAALGEWLTAVSMDEQPSAPPI